MHTAVPLSDLSDGRALGVQAGGNSYIVLCYEGQYYVYRNRCPHLGIPLEWQPHQFLDDEGELIRCASHGALFTIEDGLCVSGPCCGQFLQTVEHHLQNDQLIIEDHQN